MTRKSIAEIAKEGLTEEAWSAAEARVRKRQVRKEAASLRRKGIIRNGAIPTPIVRDSNGHIKCENGGRWTIAHGSTFTKENNQ